MARRRFAQVAQGRGPFLLYREEVAMETEYARENAEKFEIAALRVITIEGGDESRSSFVGSEYLLL